MTKEWYNWNKVLWIKKRRETEERGEVWGRKEKQNLADIGTNSLPIWSLIIYIILCI